MTVRLHHLLQPAPLVTDLDAAMDHLHALFGMFPSERVHIGPAGVDNAVYALDGMTFIELIAPYDPEQAAARLLHKRGPGWHMVSFDLPLDEPSDVDAALEGAGLRVVRRNEQQGTLAWHLHPKDTCGVLTLVARRKDPADNALYAGPAWREYVGTNTRVVGRVAGISWIAADLDELTGSLSEAFGLDFGNSRDDGDSAARTAPLPSGTFVQARAPIAPGGTAAAFLDRCGPGLYHLALTLTDRDALTERAGRLGLELTERGGSLWLGPHDPLQIPIELVD